MVHKHKNSDVDSRLRIGAEINGKDVHCCEHDMNGNIIHIEKSVTGRNEDNVITIQWNDGGMARYSKYYEKDIKEND